ncbi:MAG: hypothetical protein LUC31_03400 [Coprobacillus sp.]|nr:hypothetical protein [Coprobacillus sp.]
MKYHLPELDLEKFQTLIDSKDINISVADMLSEMYADGLYILEEDIDKENEKDSIYEEMMDYFQIDLEDEENEILAKEYFYNGITTLKNEDYESNPYHCLDIKEKELGTLELKYLSYQPYELFSFSDIIVDPNTYQELSPIGYFSQEYHYLALIDKGVIWMAVTPNEIETMKPLIKDVKGDVLIFGLGLGYLPYILSLKEEVKHITIIENNMDVIKLFKESILPLFREKKKIEILYQDAFVYLKEEAYKHHYSTFLVDIYHDANEGLPLYMKFLPYEEKYHDIDFRYWIHTSLVALARRHLLTLLYEEINKVDVTYTKSMNFSDQLINKMHDYLRDKQINSYEEIHDLLSDENIIKLLKELSK